MHLFAKERALADQLMEAMEAWVEEQRADPGGVTPEGGKRKVSSEQVEGFAAWLAERGEIAGQTARLEGAATRAW